jgi:peptidoglycan/LPS O-acetylase OafA/YrhL
MAATILKVRNIAISAPERFYLPELDSLRFFAFLAVFICHCFALAGREGAWSDVGSFGVDLFFVLSAYLITELLLRERRSRGRFDLGRFYARRILRIWPLYFTFLAGAELAGAVPQGDLAPLALFAGNFAYAAWGPPGLAVSSLWSLSVEEQFYLVWPLMMTRLSGRGAVIAGGCIWALSIASRAVMSIAERRILGLC